MGDPKELEDSLFFLEREDYREIIKKIVENKEIPESYPEEMTEAYIWQHADNPDIFSNSDNIMRFTDAFHRQCSWCLVSKDWVRILAKLLKGKKCIEIMAGKGLLSYALQQEGVDITPSDNNDWGYNDKGYTKVETKEAYKAIKEATDMDYVICAWPPYEGEDICYAIKEMAYKHPKAKLIYIGESQCGCTGCDDMWPILDPVLDGKEADIIEEVNCYYMSLYGLHDAVYLFKPNHKAKRYHKKVRNNEEEF